VVVREVVVEGRQGGKHVIIPSYLFQLKIDIMKSVLRNIISDYDPKDKKPDKRTTKRTMHTAATVVLRAKL